MDKEFLKKFETAKKNFETFGPLGVTAKDHDGIGSTPPEILQNNPGKTELDLMTDQDVVCWLKEKRKELERFSGKEFLANSFAQSYLPTLKEDIKLTLDRLRSIKRLPEEFREWKIE